MTNKEIKKRIVDWCAENGIKQKDIQEIMHIHLHNFVVGYAAPQCLIVARPWIESEKHLMDFDKKNPLETINTFDKSIKASDWCVTAYVATEYWSNIIAISHENFYKKEVANASKI